MTDFASARLPVSVDGTARAQRGRRLALPPILMRWLVPALIVAGWQAVSSLGLASPALLPSPASVLEAGWRLTLTGELPRNVGVSFLRAMAGLLVGGAIGFGFGLANGLSKLSVDDAQFRCRFHRA